MWAVTLPVLFGIVGETVIHAISTALLARVGTTELGAIAYADTVLEMCAIPFTGLVTAMQIMIARRRGEQRDDGVEAIYAGGMLLVFVTSLGLAVMLMLASPMISQAITSSDEIGRQTDRFLHIAAFGLIFYALNLGYMGLYVGLGRTRVLVSSTVLLLLITPPLSYALILGKLGAPRLGIAGAAISYLLIEVVIFVYLTVRMLTDQLTRAYRVFRTQERRPLALMLRMALPVSFKSLLERSRWLVFFVVIGLLGDDEVAWSSLLYSIFTVLLIPTDAFAETADALVSNAIGHSGPDTLRRLVRKLITAVYALTLPLVAVVVIAPQVVLSLFTDNPDDIRGSMPGLHVLALVLVVAVPAEIWLAALIGTGATYVAFGVDALLTVVFIGSTYLLAITLELPLAYVWLAPLLAGLLSWLLCSWWVRTGRWQEHSLLGRSS